MNVDLCAEYLVESVIFLVLSYIILTPVYYIWRLLSDPLHDVWPLSDTEMFSKRRTAGKIPPFYPNGWFKVCDSSSLKKGESRNLEILGQSLVVFRGMDGKASVLDAYCPHLGANMGVTASVKGNCLECPFHGWQFDHTGKCTHIPYSDASIPDQAKVRSWPVSEKNGMIHVFHHVDEVEPYWEVPDIPQIENGEFICHGRFECYIRAHCQEVPENGPDVAHLNVLHQPMVTWMPSSWIQHVWNASYVPGKDKDQYFSNVRVQQQLQIFGKNVPGSATDGKIRQIGPALVHMPLQLSVGNLVVIESVTPVEPLLQKVEHVVYGPKFPLYRPICKFILRAFSGQFVRDVHIWNNKQFHHNPVLVKGDGPIAQFRRWYSQFYCDNSKRGDQDLSW
ncbi:cholesterol 7-desaturase [Acrasis kona]|uniref:cholesterol 7-desaturase n=1 Tax=Acrasis kona TaxID=1008807 RepID=A0AAW2ZQK5_9EUKA